MRVLIANRGEIAVRVAQSVQQMGFQAIAVYADSDRGALHVRSADEAYRLAGATVGETYLDIEQILDLARVHKADAIHPGYGFLSENARFAEACGKAGITFIGPTPEVIRAMGDKIQAKEIMQKAGVPVVPGVTVTLDEEITEKAAGVGYPLLVKAAAGGGGKGMRLVRRPAELKEAVASASREAGAAFGDARVFLEKYVERPRHVEFQIFGDSHGNAVHLFERECSVQRRHQKIVEETPSPALDDDLRARMGAAAVAAARAMNYTNAGTVEFILGQDGQFYFLEVNTRLQVEHPVTEQLLGLDLVRAQLEVASGRPLPFGTLQPRGHALECRIYAEDPARGFLPSTGTLQRFSAPRAPFVRVDTGVSEGSEVTVHHDPMLAKLITWGADRSESLARMRWALRRFVVLGVTTNLEFLHDLISHEAFARGDIHTHFLEEHSIAARTENPPDEAWLVAALQRAAVRAVGATASARDSSPWADGGAWRLD